MKKTIIIALATAGFAMGAFAQGSIAGLNNSTQSVTKGLGQQNPSTAASSAYFTGALTMELFFSSTATSGNANSINALMGTAGGGAAAAALLSGFGFQAVSLTGNASTSVGFINGTANGNSQFLGFPSTVVLSTAFSPSTVGYFALDVFGTGANSSFQAVEAILSNYGGQQVSAPLGTAQTINGPLSTLGGSLNLDLTSSAVPEPSSLALAGIGGIGMLMALRRKQA